MCYEDLFIKLCLNHFGEFFFPNPFEIFSVLKIRLGPVGWSFLKPECHS